MKLFLNVPYSEKDNAKSLGARWDAETKHWYIYANKPSDYQKFARWILGDNEETVIVSKYLYILETERACFKCGKQTRIIGLGIGDFTVIYNNPDGSVYYETNNIIRLAWTENEKNIPPKLLKYLKKQYSTYTGYSNFAKSYAFSNHCDHCGVLQGNWFLFNEPDSPLSTCVEGQELLNRMHNIKIIGIPIADALLIDWDISLCDNDYAYMKYGAFYELILSSNPQDKRISYKELYEL